MIGYILENCLGDKMVMKKILIVLLLCIMFPSMLLAQDETSSPIRQYGMGSQMFTFRLGPIIPTFLYQPNQPEPLVSFPEDMRMYVGGYGSIRYQGFLSSTLALGGELGYIFSSDIGEDLFTSVPFQAKLTYIPIQGTFEVPLSIGLGFAYNSYNSLVDTSFLSLYASAEAGFSWYFREDWGITLSAGLQLIPEIYWQGYGNYMDTTLAGFMPITLSVSYRSN